MASLPTLLVFAHLKFCKSPGFERKLALSGVGAAFGWIVSRMQSMLKIQASIRAFELLLALWLYCLPRCSSSRITWIHRVHIPPFISSVLIFKATLEEVPGQKRRHAPKLNPPLGLMHKCVLSQAAWPLFVAGPLLLLLLLLLLSDACFLRVTSGCSWSGSRPTTRQWWRSSSKSSPMRCFTWTPAQIAAGPAPWWGTLGTCLAPTTATSSTPMTS